MVNTLYPICNMIIPIKTDIPPIPIRLRTPQDNAMITVYGLPSGLIYDLDLHQIIGQPLVLGRFSVLIVAQMDSTIEHCVFIIDVIDYGTIPIQKKQIENQKLLLGQSIQPILLDINDKDFTVHIDGLPSGVEYDSFLEQICGIPEIPGEYRIRVHLCNKYGTEMLYKFIIDVDGIVNQSIDLQTSVEEVLTDTVNHFHTVGDQLIYNFTINNLGNVPLFKVGIDDTKLGQFQSPIKIKPNGQAKFKCSYQLTLDDLQKDSIYINTIATAETSNGTKLTTLPYTNRIIIKGHDHTIFHIKPINVSVNSKNNTLYCSFMVTNSTEVSVDQIHPNTITTSSNITLDKHHLSSNSCLTGDFSTSLSNTSYQISLIGKTCNGITIGNTYHGTIPQNKLEVNIKLYTTSYHLTNEQPLSLVAQISGPKSRKDTKDTKDPTGTVKFYEGLKCIGKSTIRNNIATIKVTQLDLDTNLVYAIYQGDLLYNENGSNVINILSGLLNNDHTSYLESHANKFKKNISKAANILSQKNLKTKPKS